MIEMHRSVMLPRCTTRETAYNFSLFNSGWQVEVKQFVDEPLRHLTIVAAGVNTFTAIVTIKLSREALTTREEESDC